MPIKDCEWLAGWLLGPKELVVGRNSDRAHTDHGLFLSLPTVGDSV